jgi:hypothetical protein
MQLMVCTNAEWKAAASRTHSKFEMFAFGGLEKGPENNYDPAHSQFADAVAQISLIFGIYNWNKLGRNGNEVFFSWALICVGGAGRICSGANGEDRNEYGG